MVRGSSQLVTVQKDQDHTSSPSLSSLYEILDPLRAENLTGVCVGVSSQSPRPSSIKSSNSLFRVSTAWNSSFSEPTRISQSSSQKPYLDPVSVGWNN